MPDALSIRLILAALVGWLNQRQQDTVANLIEENRALEPATPGLEDRRPIQVGYGRMTHAQLARRAATSTRTASSCRSHATPVPLCPNHGHAGSNVK
jgi:hypothetical protein